MIKLIFAHDSYGRFSVNGDLPWKSHNKVDMQIFRGFTDGCILVMGRKTFESLPCRLRDLKHVVLSSTSRDMIKAKNGDNPDMVFCGETTSIITKLDKMFDNDVCVIGGRNIIDDCLDISLPDRIMCNELHSDVGVNIDEDTQFLSHNSIPCYKYEYQSRVHRYKDGITVRYYSDKTS